MQLTFKTLKQTTFTLEVEESDLVGDVKEKIKKSRPNDFGESKLKLICSGKVLEDDKSLSDYKVTDKNFVVVMAQIVKPPKETLPEPIKKSEVCAVPPENPGASAPPPVPAPPPPSDAAASAAPSNPSDSNDLLTGETLESAIRNMIEMGFERVKVEQALRMSFNNPERAVEYLISGNLPEEVSEQPAPQDQPVATPQQGIGFDPESLRNLSSEEVYPILAQVPQFQQLRALRGNPQLLSQFIQQLSVSYPDVVRAIHANENGFLDFINSDGEETNQESDQPRPPTQHIIRLTEQEKTAIERLKALGFSEDEVIQAYFACDKNEELAANLLLSDNQDDAV
ncbi:UV excision repair protein rhp23 [Taenia solium]|eukprot:TsM_000572900 transcript=TsM_000572900 gene=TsM_000572900